jgi:hypothetical protein
LIDGLGLRRNAQLIDWLIGIVPPNLSNNQPIMAQSYEIKASSNKEIECVLELNSQLPTDIIKLIQQYAAKLSPAALKIAQYLLKLLEANCSEYGISLSRHDLDFYIKNLDEFEAELKKSLNDDDRELVSIIGICSKELEKQLEDIKRKVEARNVGRAKGLNYRDFHTDPISNAKQLVQDLYKIIDPLILLVPKAAEREVPLSFLSPQIPLNN